MIYKTKDMFIFEAPICSSSFFIRKTFYQLERYAKGDDV